MPIITIEHTLSDEEINDRAKDLAHQMKERAGMVNAKAESARSYAVDIKAIDKVITKLAIAIDTGKEDRDVDCIIEKDFDTKEVRYLDVITNELIKVEPMRAKDSQLALQEDIENAENPEADIDDLATPEVDTDDPSDESGDEDDDDEFAQTTAAVGL